MDKLFENKYTRDKDSFTFGAADDFLLFLNSKGIKVK